MSGVKGKKNSDPFSRTCSNCLSPEGSDCAPKLSACVRCGTVVYCSKDCQRVHWKANHRERCIAKAERIPSRQSPKNVRESIESRARPEEQECSICLVSLTNATATTLQCAHVFHATCVADLQKFGVEQSCPLCRAPLPPGPEQLNEEAARRYTVVYRLVKRGEASWSTLPIRAQHELEAAVAGWRAAAEQGNLSAVHNMGNLYHEGSGVVQSFVEAVRWYKKAADKGQVDAQNSLGFLI